MLYIQTVMPDICLGACLDNVLHLCTSTGRGANKSPGPNKYNTRTRLPWQERVPSDGAGLLHGGEAAGWKLRDWSAARASA